jgi:hypothetical protein
MLFGSLPLGMVLDGLGSLQLRAALMLAARFEAASASSF